MSHHTSRRNFLKSLCYGAAALTVSGCADIAWRNPPKTSADKPNIVLMFIDNIGYGDLGCYGNEVVKTPRIDRFAREGVRCTDFYIGSPSCMPSRGALLTGRHGVRNGLNEQLWQAPDEAFARYGYSPDTLDERQRYRAVLTAMDDGIGRVLDKIDQLKLTQNTIVILLSDNGAFIIPARGMECASNYPLRAGGTTLWEGGIRVPCIVRWPRRIKPGTVCREPLVSMDFVPMALSAAGLDLPTDRCLDGKDPTDALAGKGPSPHKHLYWRFGSSNAAIRMGRYKLTREKMSTNQDWQLFDLETDIGETANLRSAKPELAEQLIAEHARWEKDAKTRR